MSWSHLRTALFTGLTVVSALAQSYQTQFSEVKYDRGRAPATQHDGVEVEAATGAVSIRMPLGPGVGNEGVQLVPTLTGRWSPQAKVRRSSITRTHTLPDGTVVDRSYEATQISPQGNGSFRLIPGYLDIPVLEAHGKPITFSLPDGLNGTAIEEGILTAPDIQTLEQARGLIRKFGYGTDCD